MPGRDPFFVLIAGGGVAAIEAALALRELGHGGIRVELLAPEPRFWYRPVAVAEPFERGKVLHFDLGDVADAAGAEFTLGALTAIDGARREARTDAGTTIPYDALLIACGAAPTTAIPGAITFRVRPTQIGSGHCSRRSRKARSAASVFAVPWGAVWALPAYELAFLTAARLKAYQTQNVQLEARDAGGRTSSAIRSFGRRRRPRVARRRRRHAHYTYVSGRFSRRPVANRSRAVDRGRPSPRSAATPGPSDSRRTADCRGLRAG